MVLDKHHGRIETAPPPQPRLAWLTGERRHPGEHHFADLTSLLRATTQVERRGKVMADTRYFIASVRAESFGRQDVHGPRIGD